MATRRDACSCGQLAVVCEAEPVRVSMCHCHACQRRTGSAYAAQARFPKDAVRVEGSSTAYVRAGDSGGRIEFHFCATCGSTVYYLLDGLPDFVIVTLGALAGEEQPAPKVSIYEARRLAWVSVPEGCERVD